MKIRHLLSSFPCKTLTLNAPQCSCSRRPGLCGSSLQLTSCLCMWASPQQQTCETLTRVSKPLNTFLDPRCLIPHTHSPLRRLSTLSLCAIDLLRALRGELELPSPIIDKSRTSQRIEEKQAQCRSQQRSRVVCEDRVISRRLHTRRI